MPLKHLNFQRKVESMHTSIPINGRVGERNSSLWMTGPPKRRKHPSENTSLCQPNLSKKGKYLPEIRHFCDLSCHKWAMIPCSWRSIRHFSPDKAGFLPAQARKEGLTISPSHRAPKGRGVIYKATPSTTSVVVLIDSRRVIEQESNRTQLQRSNLQELAILKSIFPTKSSSQKITSV
jgi:hypothetical protein